MKRYLILINIFLIIASVYFGVNAFYSLVSVKVNKGVTVQPVPETQQRPADRQYEPLSYYQPVIDRNLFNIQASADQSAPAETVDIETLEKTELALKLWGTVTGDRKKSYAVIEELKSKEQNLYRTGDTIQNTGATVKMILRGKVILTADGKDEILEMEDSGETPAGKAPVQTAAASQQSRTVTLNRAMITDAVSNLNQLMQQARLRPYFRRGKPEGLVISNIKSDSIFTRMGLTNGDIITGVDGQDIKSVDDVLQMYNNLKSSSSVALQINRRGQTQTITYTIQ